MAGNYPDAPSWRMAYDRDGTQGYLISSTGVITQLTSGNLATLNDEGESYLTVTNGSPSSVVFIFPELRDVDALFYCHLLASPFAVPTTMTVAVSVNTTNGLDGTWSTIGTVVPPKVAVKPAYRTGILSSTALAVRAVKFTAVNGGGASWDASAIHLYGEPAPGENPNRLALWHPTLDQRVTAAYFDWGNVPRSSSADRTFRVKNLSASLTGSSIRVAMEALTDSTPSLPGWHSLSMDGTTFLAQVTIGTLAPGAISGVLTLRRITPSNAALSLYSMRVFAEATGWA